LKRGGSAIVSPDVSYLVAFDLGLTKQGNLLRGADGHYSRPDVFELRVNTRENKNVRFESKED